jgi:hypothetical protein
VVPDELIERSHVADDDAATGPGALLGDDTGREQRFDGPQKAGSALRARERALLLQPSELGKGLFR